MFKRFANLQTESSIVRGISVLLMVILIYGLAILPSSANQPVNAATTTIATKAAPFAPTARFEDGWVEHNITQNGRKGMRVHTRFKVFSGYGYECLIVAYFYYDNGKVLKAKTNRYSTTDGQVSVNIPF